MFSKRVQQLNESPIRKFAPLSRKAREAGKNVIPLNIGQPDLITPGVFYEAVKKAQTDIIAYMPSNGIDELLEAFCNYYKRHNIDFKPKDLLITNGGSEALLFTFAALCDEGDEILAFEPYYTNYKSLATIVGAHLKGIETTPETNFNLPSREIIENSIGEKSKAIIITNPSNPTGRVLKYEDVKMLVDIAIEKNIFIIADEVYREFIYDALEFVSFTHFPEIEQRLVLIDSVSKRYNACGVRIGCIASKNEEFIAHCLKMCQARLSVAYIEQKGAAALLNSDDTFIEESRLEYQKRRNVCMKYIQKLEGVSCKMPQGAFYFIVKLPIKDAEDFVAWLLSDFDLDGDTIMLCPASEYYTAEEKGRNEVRISYCINCEKLERAMQVLDAGLKEYKRTHK